MTAPDDTDSTAGKGADGGSNAPSSDALETDLELVAVAAVADNGVIGREGDMPWHVPEDLAHFERTTTGHPVVMGRVTYESILATLDEPLPDRTSIVLTSRDLEVPDGVVLANDLRAALRAAERAAKDVHDVDRAYVIGGATIYAQYFPALDRLILTEVHENPEGDTYFPAWDRDRWGEVSREAGDGFAFVEYVRRSGE